MCENVEFRFGLPAVLSALEHDGTLKAKEKKTSNKSDKEKQVFSMDISYNKVLGARQGIMSRYGHDT